MYSWVSTKIPRLQSVTYPPSSVSKISKPWFSLLQDSTNLEIPKRKIILVGEEKQRKSLRSLTFHGSWNMKICKTLGMLTSNKRNKIGWVKRCMEDMLVSFKYLNSNLFHNTKTKVMEIKIRGGKSLKFDESSAFPVAFSIVLPLQAAARRRGNTLWERDKQIMHKKSIQPQLSLESRKAHCASFCKGHLNGCSPGWKQNDMWDQLQNQKRSPTGFDSCAISCLRFMINQKPNCLHTNVSPARLFLEFIHKVLCGHISGHGYWGHGNFTASRSYPSARMAARVGGLAWPRLGHQDNKMCEGVCIFIVSHWSSYHIYALYYAILLIIYVYIVMIMMVMISTRVFLFAKSGHSYQLHVARSENFSTVAMWQMQKDSILTRCLRFANLTKRRWLMCCSTKWCFI